MDASHATSLLSFVSQESPRIRPADQPVCFFDLPAEIRLRIYELVLVQPGNTVDLDPANYRHIRPRLWCFMVCRQMHEEAYRVFYGSPQQPLRLYPVHGRFFHTKKPLLTRLSPQYRRVVNTVELRLGPGWSSPPRCWNTDPALGLKDCKSLRTLKIFIQCDPSDETFNGFRGRGNTKDTYKMFCVALLSSIIDQVPSLDNVEVDAFSAVPSDSPLVNALVAEVHSARKRLLWGPSRDWRKETDVGGNVGLEEQFMAALDLRSMLSA